MIKCLILDLDMTLIDTSAMENLRENGSWQEVESRLHLCAPYSQVIDVLNTARPAGLKVCVFTNSPSSYAERLLKYFNISIDYLVAYRDVRKHKPDSEGVEKILSRFNITANEAVYLGDSRDDYMSSKSANVEYFAVDWSDPKVVPKENFGVTKLLEYIGSGTSNSQGKSNRTNLIQNGNHFYLGYYLAGIKQKIWDFKDGKEDAVNRWMHKASELAESLPNIDYVVRALGHAEIEVNSSSHQTPLDRLSLKIASSLGAAYIPSLLKKNCVLVKSTKCSAKERESQVRGVYSVDTNLMDSSRNDPVTFLVVDDVLTSGATTEEITRAISDAYPGARIYIFTLVKTLYRSQGGEPTIEAQHTAKLFSDLHTYLSEPSGPFSRDAKFTKKYKGNNLVSKNYSANYSRTNHNFIIQNLKTCSIASEPKLKPILNAVYILKNMLQRGKPTIASRNLLKSFNCNSGQIIKEDCQALISQKTIVWKRLIRGDTKSDEFPAKRFFDELIPKYFGEYAFVKQLTLPEVQIFDMTQVYVDKFNNRQVDFFIPQVGLIIEIDGLQHRQSKEIDLSRDKFTESLGLKTIRITTQEIASEGQEFLNKISCIIEHISRIDKLEQEGIQLPPNGITLQQYKNAYNNGVDKNSPSVRLTAAIRFQLLLLELIETGDIRLGEKSELTLLNRDGIDFANDAINDLREYLEELLILMGIEDCALNVQVTEIESEQSRKITSGVIIDFSILERFDDGFQTLPDVIISRTHYLDFYRYFSDGDAMSMENTSLEDYDYFEMACSAPVTYELDLSPDSRQRTALKFFLSNLFLPSIKDVDFREGQVGIIGSALARKGTIGLLPTGSGKSICYQLSAILQPAVSFVVCPIKSLMYDQKADLDSIGFSRSNFITSELRPDQKAKVQRDYGRGKYYFVFISPERFQTHQFRSEMTAIGLDRSFAYAVIDEVHCLSEWGHDFRTSYLNLANTIGRLAPEASYIGLTATASINVLKDIQTEFRVPDENVRTPLEFTREELSFHVIDDKGRKGYSVQTLVKGMESKWNADGGSKAGIIFTPTVNGNKGCFELAGTLSASLKMDVHFYSGSVPKGFRLQGAAFDDYKKNVQTDFKENKYKLLVATKAFGMGVNKGNIAYTIHFGIPGSMEALYQEAGRAGRDKKLFKEVPADCYVLLTKEPNESVLDSIWDASTKITDLKSNVSKLTRDSDVNTNLWLMTNSLDTINDEYRLIASIYSFLESNRDARIIVASASQFNTDKTKFEKAIHRLAQLGIILDWVIEDFFKGVIQIEFECLGEDQLRENIEATIKKYEPTFRLSDLLSSSNDFHAILNDRLSKGSISQTQYIILVLLLWSYDHFVYNRRQSLKTVYEQCSDLASKKISEAEFKYRLEGYFKFNNSSHLLLHLAESAINTSQWLSVFFEESESADTRNIIPDDKLITLKEQLSRFLESYKDNAFLNYISGIIRLASDQFDDADGERRMSRALDDIANRPFIEVEQLITDTVKLKKLFSTDNQCRFARLIHEKFPQHHILEILNTGFQDPYTYSKLLEPLSTRLQNLTQKYKGVSW